MLLDPINGIRDSMPIQIGDMNATMSNTTSSVNQLASLRNTAVDTINVIDNISAALPRKMGENIGTVLLGTNNDATLYMPLAQYVSTVNNGMFINHSLFPLITDFYLADAAMSAYMLTADATSPISLSNDNSTQQQMGAPFTVKYVINNRTPFDTLVILMNNDAFIHVGIYYNTNVDTAYGANAIIYKFMQPVMSTIAYVSAPLLNAQYLADVEAVLVGSSTITGSFSAVTSPFTALIPNAAYNMQVIGTISQTGTITVAASAGSSSFTQVYQANGLTTQSPSVSNHIRSYTGTSVTSSGSASFTAPFEPDESSTFALLGNDQAKTYPTTFSYDSNGNMVSYLYISSSLQLPTTLNAIFYDTEGFEVYNTLQTGIYKAVYNPDQYAAMLSLFGSMYAIMIPANNIAISNTSIAISAPAISSSIAINNMLDSTYIPPAIASANIANINYKATNVSLAGSEVFSTTTYTMNGSMLSAQLPSTISAAASSNAIAVVNANGTFTAVMDAQFVAASSYVACNIDLSKHPELNGTISTVYAISTPMPSSTNTGSASSSFSGNAIVCAVIVSAATSTNISVYSNGTSVYSGQTANQYVWLGPTMVGNVTIAANGPVQVSFIAPSQISTLPIYVPSLMAFSSITTSAASYSVNIVDLSNTNLATYTNTSTVNLNTSSNSVFKLQSASVDAIPTMTLNFTYSDTNSLLYTNEFIGYDTELFSISAQYKGYGFVPSVTSLAINSLKG